MELFLLSVAKPAWQFGDPIQIFLEISFKIYCFYDSKDGKYVHIIWPYCQADFATAYLSTMHSRLLSPPPLLTGAVLQVFVIDDLYLSEAGPPIVAAAVKQNNAKADDGEKEKVKIFFMFQLMWPVQKLFKITMPSTYSCKED